MLSIGALTPNPRRADRVVDAEGGADADQVREQVEQAEAGEYLDDAHIDQQRGRRNQAEAEEPARRGSPMSEGPHLVEQVVVHDRHVDRHHGRREQREPQQPVQREQDDVVDHEATRADDREPAQPWQRLEYARPPAPLPSTGRGRGMGWRHGTPARWMPGMIADRRHGRALHDA
jgi:hypothetical protein